MRPLVIPASPQKAVSAGARGPANPERISGRRIATWDTEAMARPAFNILLVGSEKLLSFAASCAGSQEG